jgi:hypothetical protein
LLFSTPESTKKLNLDDIQNTFTKENTEELFDNKESAIRFLEELPQWIQQERSVSQLCDD